MQDRAGSTTKKRVSQIVAGVAAWVHRLVEAMAHRGRGSRVRRLQMIESLELGNRRQLFLIACDDQPFLVGAGADRVGTLVAVPLGLTEPHAFSSGVKGAQPAGQLPAVFRRGGTLRQSAHVGGSGGLQLVKAIHEGEGLQGASVMEPGKRLWP